MVQASPGIGQASPGDAQVWFRYTASISPPTYVFTYAYVVCLLYVACLLVLEAFYVIVTGYE